MNRILEILKSIPLTIIKFVDNLDKKTEEKIRQGAFTLGFVLFISAIIIGYKMGKDEARIKTAPLAEYVNDTFKIDISRERDESTLGKMLESELISESRYSSYRKIQYPAQDIIEQETDDSVFEPGIEKRIHNKPEPDKNDRPIEGTYRQGKIKYDVVPLVKEKAGEKAEKTLIMEKNKTADLKNLAPEKTENGKKSEKKIPSLILNDGVVE